MSGDDLHSVRPLSDLLSDLEVGLLADIFRQASRAWWLSRADDFERAKPRLDEFHGNRSREELRRQWRECHDIARACRAKAALMQLSEEDLELVRGVA